MHSQEFSVPHRQSEVGIVLIFLTTLYKLLRGFWAVGAYLIFSKPNGTILVYIVVGLVVLGVLVLGYSYVYYRKFIFHIDYEKEAFILQKGVFSSQNTEIPFDKIQQVNTEQSLLQRLINVHSLVIDTAGGEKKEAEIKAISKAKAHRLSEILMEMKEPETVEVSGNETEDSTFSQVEWHYKMDFLTLLKIGISSNFLRGFTLLLVFFSTIYQEVSRWAGQYSVDEYMNELPDPAASISTLLVIFLVVLMGSMLITVIEVFIKYFNLKLYRTKRSLHLEMGLKTNKKVSLQPRRVQWLQIKTNPIQKKLDLHELKISLASSEDSFGKSKLKIPGIGKAILEKVTTFLFTAEKSNFQKNFQPHIILFFRRFLFSLLPVLIGAIALFLTPFVDFKLFVLLAVLYSVLMGTYQFLSFKALELFITEDFLGKKHGVWNKRVGKIQAYKLQAITVSTPYFYKKRNLVNLTFHTAGGDISFPAVDKKILPFINYLLFKIEVSREDWM